MKKFIFILAAFGLALSAEAQETCSPTADINQDGIVGTGDLLALLSDYGVADADFDGINDLFDDCIEDECGVCDGPGATLILIDAITVLYDSAYLPLQDEWFVYEIGADTTFVVQCEIFGCLDPTACNFSDEANVDNGNCDYISCYGCNIPSACNFDALATMFDESCDFESCAGCLDSLACNYDPDNTIAIDLLCDFESCTGCTDQDATNFDPAATIDDGNCAYGPESCDGLFAIDYYGVSYNVIEIGDQCWFKENLSTVQFTNGDSILLGAGLSSAPYAQMQIYSNISYYNFYCTIDSRGVCPTGWHVPTDEDWMALELFIGIPASSLENSGRGNPFGWDLKAAPGPPPAWDGTDLYGFAATPSSYVSGSGGTNSVNGSYQKAYYWSSSTSLMDGSEAWMRRLDQNQGSVYRYDYAKFFCLPIRCVKD